MKFKWLLIIAGMSQAILVHGSEKNVRLEGGEDGHETSVVCRTPPPTYDDGRKSDKERPSSSGCSSMTFEERSPVLSAQVSPRGPTVEGGLHLDGLAVEGRASAPEERGAVLSAQVSPRGPTGIEGGLKDMPGLSLDGLAVGVGAPASLGALTFIKRVEEDDNTLGGDEPQLSPAITQVLALLLYDRKTPPKVTLGKSEKAGEVKYRHRLKLTELSRLLSLALQGTSPGDDTG